MQMSFCLMFEMYRMNDIWKKYHHLTSLIDCNAYLHNSFVTVTIVCV